MFKSVALLSLLCALPSIAQPSPKDATLLWEQCSDFDIELPVSYNCSILTVPLDYSAPQNASIDLQLVRIDAASKPARGSILFNFGGPGSGARQSLLAFAPQLLASTGGVYDLITFDPRGTANTIPFNCSKTDLELYALGAGVLPGNASDAAVAQGWIHANRVANQCFDVEKDIGPYIGTASVARDLISVVDALGEDGKLRYWGFSYGTTLGATVAAMFPDRMDRIILDAVQNVHEYYNAIGITEQWLDADKVFSGIWSTCLDAGAELCPLAASYNDSQVLEDAVWNLMWSAKYSPIPVGSNGSFFLDYAAIKSLMVSSFYTTAMWPTTAIIVDMILKGQTGDELLDIIASTMPTSPAGIVTDAKLIAANYGIQCSDRSSTAQTESLDKIRPTLNTNRNNSRLMGDMTDSTIMSCNVWKFHARERYDGDWQDIRTPNPMLIVANSYDGLTPLVSAHNISESFVDSVVLEVNGYGHGSLTLQSNCATAATAAYFVNGTMPERGTVCPIDVLPYHPVS